MTTILKCPTCGKEVPAPKGGKRFAKCKSCGEAFDLPEPQALCEACGVDITRQKRTKDAEGVCYCEPCFYARLTAAQKLKTAAAAKVVCGICGGVFPGTKVSKRNGIFLCDDCDERNAPATRAPAQLPRPQKSSARAEYSARLVNSMVVLFIILGIAAVGVAVYYVLRPELPPWMQHFGHFHWPASAPTAPAKAN